MSKPHKNAPHVHAELIKAWADGAEIQWRWGHINDEWETTTTPHWQSDCEFRIKPQPKPDVVVFPHRVIGFKPDCKWNVEYPTKEQLKLTFDGETGKLKAAEVL